MKRALPWIPIAVVSIGLSLAEPAEPVIVDVDCDAGEDLALAIRRAEGLAGRPSRGPVARSPGSRLDGDGRPRSSFQPYHAMRPIEVNVSGHCVADLRLTASALTLQGVTDDATIVGSEEECTPQRGSAIEDCPVVGIENATDVVIMDLSIVQNRRGGRSGPRQTGASAVNSRFKLVRCEIETASDVALSAARSDVEVWSSTILGGESFAVVGDDSRMWIVRSEIVSRGVERQDLVLALREADVAVDTSVLRGGADIPGRCLANFHSSLRLGGTDFENVRVQVGRNSSLDLEGGSVERVALWGFSTAMLNTSIGELELSGFSRAISTNKAIGELSCDDTSDASCDPRAVIGDSTCASCRGAP